MSYILKQTGTSYAINHNNKSYNAGNDITLAMEVIGKLNNFYFNANLESRFDGLYVCWGDHQGYEGCNYVKVISYIPASFTQPSGTTTVTDNTVPYTQPVRETTAVPDYTWKPTEWIYPPSTPIPTVPWNPSIAPQPVTGWLCPRCGNGVSPYTSICPCNHKVTITC